MTAPRIRPLGDSVVLVEFEPVIDPHVNARVLALAHAVTRLDLQGVRDVVPAYAALGVHVDPSKVEADAVARRLADLVSQGPSDDCVPEGDEIVVPVRYGGEEGPDLTAIAAWAGLSEAEVVARHADRTYRVFMIGFAPGFPYMGVVDEAIAMPRRETPRARVPAGSVGIAGRQTGIYPLQTPGGWRVIGRTDIALFDLAREHPALLAPGQRVRFAPLGGAARPT